MLYCSVPCLWGYSVLLDAMCAMSVLPDAMCTTVCWLRAEVSKCTKLDKMHGHYVFADLLA